MRKDFRKLGGDDIFTEIIREVVAFVAHYISFKIAQRKGSIAIYHPYSILSMGPFTFPQDLRLGIFLLDNAKQQWF